MNRYRMTTNPLEVKDLIDVVALYQEFAGIDHEDAVMDIESVDSEFSMDWKGLLSGKEFDRNHDFAGFCRHLDRGTFPAKMKDCFIPRFNRWR